MHIKHIHETLEKLSGYACKEASKAMEEINTEELGEVIDMVKDLCEAEYYGRIAKAMEESEKEDEENAKRIMKEMKEQYGEEEGERRFYDNYRYKRSGRYAPKGRGSYVGRRGYMEMYMPEMNMPEMYRDDADWYRDMDRESQNRLYYTENGMRGNSGNSGNMNNSSGSSASNNSRGYEEGRRDGEDIGYRRGYEEGERNGRRNSGGQSRYDKARRGYEETKTAHNSNSTEDKQLNMKEMEKVLTVVFDEIDEMLEDASPEMKAMVKNKGISRFQKM